jgi:hypothetical protein
MIDIEREEMNRRIDALINHIEYIPGGVKKAVRGAVSRAAASGKEAGITKIPGTYAISEKELRKRAGIRTRIRADPHDNEIVGEISFSGTNIPLYSFNVTPRHTTPLESEHVSAGVLAGSLTPFSTAFIAMMDSGHTGIFTRTPGAYMRRRPGKTKHSEQINEYHAPSVAGLAANGEVTEEITKRVYDMFEARMEHEVYRILEMLPEKARRIN